VLCHFRHEVQEAAKALLRFLKDEPVDDAARRHPRRAHVGARKAAFYAVFCQQLSPYSAHSKPIQIPYRSHAEPMQSPYRYE